MEPAPVGSYPEELLAAAPGGMVSWDDVAVRYEYYKQRGYLRGETICDQQIKERNLHKMLQ